MKSNPIIGIVVPIYNVENYLRRCLDSLIHQTYPHLQIVLVNDGSTDQSLKIAKEYLKKDPRFILIDKPNGGLSSARNTGIEFFKKQFVLKACDETNPRDEVNPHNEMESCNAKKYSEIKKCDEMESRNEVTKPHNQTEKHSETKLKTKNCFKITGENPRNIYSIFSSSPPPTLEEISYLFFVDSDDSIHLNCLETYLKNAEEHSLEIIASGIEYRSEEDKFLGANFGFFEGVKQKEVLNGEEMLKQISNKFFCAAWNILINFDFFKKAQVSFIDGILYEDCTFGTLLFLQAKRVMVLEHHFYIYSSRPDSITRPKTITEERRILDAESWFQTIKKLEAFPLGGEIIERHIRNYYLRSLYSCAIEFQDNEKYIKMLRNFKYNRLRMALLENFPKSTLLMKRIKQWRLKVFIRRSFSKIFTILRNIKHSSFGDPLKH